MHVNLDKNLWLKAFVSLYQLFLLCEVTCLSMLLVVFVVVLTLLKEVNFKMLYSGVVVCILIYKQSKMLLITSKGEWTPT